MLYALAFPPLRWRLLAWIALVPFLLVLRGASLRRRLALGAWLSLVVGGANGTWMPAAVASYFEQPLAVGFALFLFVTLAMAAPYYMAFAAVYAPLARGSGAVAPLLAGAAWAGAELLRGRLLNGDLAYLGNSPWATFGYAQTGVDAVVQIAAVTGVYGVSFVLAAANAALAETVRDLGRRRAPGAHARSGLVSAALLVAATIALGAIALRGAPAPGELAGTRVALAQANLGAAARWTDGGGVHTLDAYLRLTREAFERGQPELVFWPEAALTAFVEREPAYLRAIGAALGGAELVVGAPRAEGPDGSAPYRNSVYLAGPDGAVRGRYDKQYLLPFMEYFPLRVDFARRHFGRVREFTPGAPTPPLATRAGAAGMLVCNEAFLPHIAAARVAAGATYLVSPSNDSWVPNAGFAWQQFDIAAMRAVEQRRFLVRVSDSGPSGVVDPYGRVVAHTDALARATLRAAIAPVETASFYGRVGDAFGVACALVTLAALGRTLRARARQVA